LQSFDCAIDRKTFGNSTEIDLNAPAKMHGIIFSRMISRQLLLPLRARVMSKIPALACAIF
jgi:hypothetical protein